MLATDQKPGGAAAHIIYKGQSYDLEELSLMSRESLLEIKSEIDTEMVSIQLQLEQSPGAQYENPEWFAKVSARLRWRKRDWHFINRALEIGGLRRKAKNRELRGVPLTPEERQARAAQDVIRQSEFDRRFVDSAKIVLTDATFKRILQMAKQKQVEE
jgi:hypothetical protein